MGIEPQPSRMKVVYTKSVAVEGLVVEEDSHIRLSLDEGKTWALIHKSDVRSCIPTHY